MPLPKIKSGAGVKVKSPIMRVLGTKQSPRPSTRSTNGRY